MENHEKKYKDLEGKIKKAYLYAQTDSTKAVLEDILPELAESEDEKIRKWLIGYFNQYIIDGMPQVFGNGLNVKDVIAWLEKQGKKTQGKSALEAIKEKPANNANKVEPKFKVGDWITNSIETVQINGYDIDYGYQVDYKGNLQHRDTDIIENEYHLWTIEDAEDGDVLATENFIFIFKNIDDGNGVHYYCQYEIIKHEDDNQFDIALPQSLMGRVGNSISHYSPATQEQRNILFQKMKEAGYEWDVEKKEPKKIDQKPAWNEEDEKNLTRAVWYVENPALRVKDTMLSEWLKSIKERVQPQPKQ